MRIGIDVMGGDHAPDAILAGSLDALAHLSPTDTLVLIGDQAIIADVIAERGLKNEKRLQIEPTTQVITMNDPPVSALRTKTDSSIVRMADATFCRSGASKKSIVSTALSRCRRSCNERSSSACRDDVLPDFLRAAASRRSASRSIVR